VPRGPAPTAADRPGPRARSGRDFAGAREMRMEARACARLGSLACALALRALLQPRVAAADTSAEQPPLTKAEAELREHF
jgi:hypothetical protein